jgi:hypothetical protein
VCASAAGYQIQSVVLQLCQQLGFFYFFIFLFFYLNVGDARARPVVRTLLLVMERLFAKLAEQLVS